jgi:dTDP-4-dehydrorhamnose reductase
LRLLVTGCNGQLGWELARALAPLGEVTATNRATLDLSRPETIAPVIRTLKPDVILNAAAYTAVDQAESEPVLAAAINTTAPAILAEEAKRSGALLVHYSTDYVFDGTKASPYIEEDATNPLSVYGQTKLDGERAIQASGCEHLILRTSWVYGPRGKNFLLTMLRLAHDKPVLRVVDDQIGAPTAVHTLAAATASILQCRQAGQSGLFHLTASGHTSWHGFAKLIVSLAGPPYPEVAAIPTSAYPTAAKRPLNSRLDCTKVAAQCGLQLPDWERVVREVTAQVLATATGRT